MIFIKIGMKKDWITYRYNRDLRRGPQPWGRYIVESPDRIHPSHTATKTTIEVINFFYIKSIEGLL